MTFSKKINYFNFKDKIVVVTGCSGIIGKKICEEFINCGSIVLGIDKKNNCIKNKNFFFKKVDLTNLKEIKKILKEIIKSYKLIDIIINCAAISYFTHFEKRSAIEIKKTIDINLIAVINIIKNYVELHKKNKLSCCKIINFGSIYGSYSPDFNIYKSGDRFNSEIYGATKASIIQLTKYLAVMYAKYNININCISPGGTINEKSKLKKGFYSRYSKKVPLERMATPKDIITTVMYLASDHTTYTIGQNIIVDGGLTLC
jgi:3-oxoacyl-[acyl-carrier protein] reductase